MKVWFSHSFFCFSSNFFQGHTDTSDRLVLCFPSLPMPHKAASARSTGMFMTMHEHGSVVLEKIHAFKH